MVVFKRLAGFHVNEGVCSLATVSKEVGINAVIGRSRRCALLLDDTCGNAVIGHREVCITSARVIYNCLIITLVGSVRKMSAHVAMALTISSENKPTSLCQ